MEILLTEKAKLTQENARLLRENTGLQVGRGYHGSGSRVRGGGQKVHAKGGYTDFVRLTC